MRIPVGQKLFWTVLAVTTLIIVTVIVATSFNLRHGIASYISAAQLSFLDEFATELEGIHTSEQGWSKLAQDQQRWDGLVEKAVQLLEAKRRQQHMPEHNKFNSRPPPFDRINQRDRMALLDAQGKLLIGNPGSLLDGAARRPLQAQGQLIGFLSIAAPSLPNEMDETFLRGVGRSLLLVGALGFLLSALAAWLLARSFTRPLKLLRYGTAQLAGGNYNTRIAVKRRDEFGDLVRDFNLMGEALGRQESSRRQWVADTSHELRTPITILRAQIEAMRDKVFRADESNIGKLHREVLALGKLVDDLHELARADAGGLALQRATLDPLELVDEVVTGSAARFHAKSIAVEFANRTSAGLTVFADPHRLRQLFANIIENALRYTDSPGRLRIACHPQGSSLVISFEDTAPGVTDADRARLFDRFYRTDASRNRAVAGSGLGLAICKSIAEAHGGTITAAPSALGGLHIDVTLPRQQGGPS